MRFRTNRLESRDINLTNTKYDNMALYVKLELNRMMKCICMCERWAPSNHNLFTFNLTFSELNLEVDLRVDFNEFKNAEEIITAIIRDVKNKINEKIMV